MIYVYDQVNFSGRSKKRKLREESSLEEDV